MWDGSPVPAALRCRVLREWARVELINAQIAELESGRLELVKAWQSPEAETDLAASVMLAHLLPSAQVL